MKMDATRIRVAEFWKVRGCPLGAALRKKLKRAKADPIIAPSKGQVLWEVSVEGPSSAPFIGRKYQHDEVFCYLSTPWGEYEKIWTGFTGRVVEVCAKQGDVVNKGDVIAYIQRSDIFA